MSTPIFQIRIILKDSEPPIWRQLLVSSDLTLAAFHHIIQQAMGWTDSHLYLFCKDTVRFTFPYEPEDLDEMTAIDARQVELGHIIPVRRPYRGEFRHEIEYQYDLGDGWVHQIVFEDVLPPDPQRRTPVCISGARACPPEDIGGIEGYKSFLEARSGSEPHEYEMYRESAGDDFDPEAFDIKAVNKRLKGI